MTNLFNDQMNSNFVWYVGIVEEINDPKEAGRVKVRCFGIHTADKAILPTEDLPWATVMSPTSSANLKGIKSPVHGLLIGSMVVGFFMDGDARQVPLVMGSLPGIAPSEPGNINSEYTTDTRSNPDFIPGENDYGLLATTNDGYPLEDNYHPMTSSMATNRKSAVATAAPAKVQKVDGDSFSDYYYSNPTWDEPVGREELLRGFYPFTKTDESQSGHVIEIDDNINEPRLLWYHSNGTFQEFTNSGRHLRVKGANYEVIHGPNYIYVNGDCNLTVAGDTRQLVQGNYHLEVLKDYTIKVHGNMKREITGNDLKQITSYESSFVNIDSTKQVMGEFRQYGGQIKLDSSDFIDLTASFNIDLNAGFLGIGAISLNSAGTLSMNATLAANLTSGISTNITSPVLVNIVSAGAIYSTAPAIVATAAGTLALLSTDTTMTSSTSITAVAPRIDLNPI
jgi:hypothetical protein